MVPKKDADFIAYARFFTEQIRINQDKWGIREAQFVPLRRANNAAQAAWLKHTDKQTAGNAATIDKDDTFDALRFLITLMHDTLRGAIDTVTDNELNHLGVSPRRRPAHEKLVMPAVDPNLVVKRSGFYKFAALSKEQELGTQRTRTIRNKRLHPMIVVRYCFIAIDAALPVDLEKFDWTTNQAVGHAKTTIDATGKGGMKLVVQSAFHNTAGTGPWSEPFEIIVS